MVTKIPKQAGLFTQQAGLLIDDNGMRRVNFRVTGRIKNVPATTTMAEKRQ